MRYRYRHRRHLLGLGVLLGGLYLLHHPWLVQDIKARVMDGQIPSLALNDTSLSGPSDVSTGALSGLPNAALTPGALNPAVTPDDLYSTICRRGWTRTIRPRSPVPS